RRFTASLVPLLPSQSAAARRPAADCLARLVRSNSWPELRWRAAGGPKSEGNQARARRPAFPALAASPRANGSLLRPAAAEPAWAPVGTAPEYSDLRAP